MIKFKDLFTKTKDYITGNMIGGRLPTVHEKYSKVYDSIRSNKDVIYGYTKGSKSLNHGIIFNPTDDILKKKHDLTNAISGVKLHEDTTVHSGTRKWNPNVNRGDILHTKAFTSTSLDRDLATNINRTELNSENGKNISTFHEIHFHLPEGSEHGAYIGHISKFPNEMEFLLKPDQKWKVTHTELKIHHEDGGFWTKHYYVEPAETTGVG